MCYINVAVLCRWPQNLPLFSLHPLSDESVKRKVVDDEASEVPEKRAKKDEVEVVEEKKEEATA